MSLFLFGLGSTLCAFAPNIIVISILRFVQGMGGGMLIPVGMTFIYKLYDKSEYASITSYTFIPSLIAPALAPFLGGVFLTLFGWRYVFVFSGPICLFLALFSLIMLKEFEMDSKKPFDWPGFIMISLLLVDVFFALSSISHGPFNLVTLIYFLFAILLTPLFIYKEKLSKHPLIRIDYFKNKTFTRVNLIQLCFQSCHFGAIFLIGMYLQIGVGFSAMMAGLIMGMQAVGAMTTSRLSVRLFNRVSQRFPIIMGLVGVAILTPFALLISNTHFLMFALILFFIRGIFSGLCGTPIQTLSVIGFQTSQISMVTAMFNVCRQVSISLGVAVSSLLISFGLRSNHWVTGMVMSYHQAISIFRYGFFAIFIIAMIGAMIAIRIYPVVSAE